MSQLPNVYATPYFLKKLIHLLKVKEKFFDLLKPKSYLSRLENIACHTIQINALFTACQKLLKSYFPANFSLELHQDN